MVSSHAARRSSVNLVGWVGGRVGRALVLLLVRGEVGLGDLPEGLLERAEGEVADEDVVDVVKALRGEEAEGSASALFPQKRIGRSNVCWARGAAARTTSPYISPASARTVRRRPREESATTRAARVSVAFPAKLERHEDRRGADGRRTEPREAAGCRVDEMSRRTRRGPGDPRDASARETSGAMSAEMFMSCAGEFAACVESRARRVARRGLLGSYQKAAKLARELSIPKKIALSGGATVHKSRHVCASWRQPGRRPRHRDLANGTAGLKIYEHGR